MIKFIPEKYDSMSKPEKIKIGMICCDTCTKNCNGDDGADCLIQTNKKFAVRIIRSKLWKSVLYYEYKLWQADIPKMPEYLPERLFEI